MDIYANLRVKLALVFSRAPFVAATITRTIPGAYSPVGSRKVATGTTSTIPARAFSETVETTAADGSRSSYTTITLNIAPMIGDKITLGGSTYRVIDTDAERPDGGEALMYEATVAL